jgi:NADH-quinone oxidoreductase subunit N
MNYADLFRATLPETVLEAAALLLLFIDLGFLRRAALRTRIVVATLAGIAGCVAALVAIPLGHFGLQGPDGFTLLASGGTAAIAQCAILILTILTLLLFIDSEFTRHPGEYVAIVLMAASGGLIVAAAQDLLVIFIGLELLSLGLYVLTAFAKQSAKSAEAAMKYYLFGGMSAAFLLFGFSYFYGLTGSTNLAVIEWTIAFSGATPLFYVAWVFVVVGLGFKIAAVPFHIWAPDTYEGAPAPAAAFIASVSKVASFALLINLSRQWLEPYIISDLVPEHAMTQYYAAWPTVAVVLIIVSVASMLWGNLAALAQSSVRRLLAYSAIAHSGYILIALAVHPNHFGQTDSEIFAAYGGESFLTARPIAAILYYILTYGLTTIGAFGVVGVVERATSSDKLDSFLGLHKRNPLLAAVLLVFFLSLAGIPPLVGFWAKFNLFAAVLAVGAGPVPFALVALAVALSAVSLYYYLQVLKRAYVLPAVDESPIRVHPVTAVVLVLIAAAVVVLGCFPALLGNWIASFYA